MPNKRIVQAWREAVWPAGEYSIVRFELQPEQGKTKVVLDHTGFSPGDFMHLEPGWKVRYWEPLKKIPRGKEIDQKTEAGVSAALKRSPMAEKFILIGSGLAGGLLAAYLGRRGYEVELYERRADPREGELCRRTLDQSRAFHAWNSRARTTWHRR